LARAKKSPHTNRLLDDLPRRVHHDLLADCEHVELALGRVLAEPGKPIGHVYFPSESFISLVTEMGGGPSLEVALVGNEGMLGVPLVLGIGISPVHAVVQGAGAAWRMSAARFRRALVEGHALRRVLHRYLFVLMSQLGQTAGCTRFHVVEERLARWLLMTADRAHSETFYMTHELLAYTLGVRRVGVTCAASSLQKGNLIRYSRGDIAILDRKGLEKASCRCYRADLATYDRILARIPRPKRTRALAPSP
jgi:CRP-like cAMP-binding protein